MLHLVFAGQTGIAMTGSTSLGQVQFKDRRIGVLDGQNVVVAVAIHATCGARGAESVADAVNAGGVLPSRLFMASAAIDRLGRDVIVGVFGGYIGMATGAGIGLMDGACEQRLIDEQGDFFPSGIGFAECLVCMAIQAGGVGIFFGSLERKWSQAEHSTQTTNKNCQAGTLAACDDWARRV